jgi:hypothetical protein
VHDFELVAVGEFRRRPEIATDEFAIKFDGYAVGFHAELCDQLSKSLDGAEFAILTIDG